MRESRPLDAVHVRDLEAVLTRLGITRLQLSEMRCSRCSAPIEVETLGALAYRNGRVVAVCNTPGCLQAEATRTQDDAVHGANPRHRG